MGALDGIRVLDLGLLVQGPQAAALLGDMGATVIKVELPSIGDQARWLPVSSTDLRSGIFIGSNRGKRSITVDLRTPGGVSVLLKLVDTADVLIANFKPGTLEDWGIGYDELAARNPRIIVGLGSTFGPVGPTSTREGADMAGQAAGGLIASTGVDGGEPTPVGATIADHISSQHLAAGILGALYARERTGRGQKIEVSLLGGQVWAQAGEYTHYFLSGENPGRANYGHALIRGIYGIFPTADGWLAIVGVPVPVRPAFAKLLGSPPFLDEPRFASPLLTKTDRDDIQVLLSEILRTRTTVEWVDSLAAAGVRVAPVNNYAMAAADPQLALNGYVQEIDHPEWGTVRMVGSPLRMSDTPVVPGRFIPELGQHTEEILVELGYNWDDITALRDSGAI